MEYYPNEVHKERKISEQIEMRIDEHIPKDYLQNLETYNKEYILY